MTLAFSQTINDKPTYFVEKIWQCFPEEYKAVYFNDFLEGLIEIDYDFQVNASDFRAKKHTIRRDKSNRWEAGTKIHFSINVRKKNLFQFAPVINVISTQSIEINNIAPFLCGVFIDGNELSGKEIETLALNDGFDTVDDFWNYFTEDFKGKIIHWTNLKY